MANMTMGAACAAPILDPQVISVQRAAPGGYFSNTAFLLSSNPSASRRMK
jgi:hypothetical protein